MKGPARVLTWLYRRLLPRTDDRAALLPLWQRVVEIAREPQWYAKGGMADTKAGRFDCITLVLALVLLRMERDPALIAPAARLTELFVADMDGQMRQAGVGDLMVGKRMGKLMQALGGRIAALRTALAEQGDGELIAAVERNVTLADRADPAWIAAALRRLAADLQSTSDGDLLAGKIAR